MQVDALAIRLRPRTPMEAADLGVRLCQSAARDRCIAAISSSPCRYARCALATFEIADWLPSAGDVVGQAVARSHHSVRAVARRVRTAHVARRPVAGAAAGVVEPAASHADVAAPVAVALVHATCVSARRTCRSGKCASACCRFAQAHAARAVHDVGIQLLRDQRLRRRRCRSLLWFAPQGQAPDFRQLFSDEMATSLALVHVRGLLRSPCCSSSRSTWPSGSRCI